MAKAKSYLLLSLQLLFGPFSSVVSTLTFHDYSKEDVLKTRWRILNKT